MDTNVKALQHLYVALGGDLTDTYDALHEDVAVSDYTTIADMINAIALLKGYTPEEANEEPSGEPVQEPVEPSGDEEGQEGE